MINKLKLYKLNKIKKALKNYPFIFLVHTPNLNSQNLLKIEQQLFKNTLHCYKINNNLTKLVLKNSLFSSFVNLVQGPLCFIYFNPKHSSLNLNLEKLLVNKSKIIVLGVKLNKRIYTKSQIKTLNTFNYNQNIIIFNKTLKKIIKTPYHKLKSFSK